MDCKTIAIGIATSVSHLTIKLKRTEASKCRTERVLIQIVLIRSADAKASHPVVIGRWMEKCAERQIPQNEIRYTGPACTLLRSIPFTDTPPNFVQEVAN